MMGPVIQGWCPGALRPMMSGDGLVVRVRPRACRLAPHQAAGIATLAARHGNGLIDLSARANIQLRGVTEATYPALIDGLRALHLIDATPEAEAARNLIVTPFWTSGDGTEPLAQTLSDALCHPEAPRLPGKFGVALDTGPQPVLRDTSADIRIERGAAGGLIVVADGMATGAAATIKTLAETVLALARWFAAHGIACGRGRMAALVALGAVPPAAFLAAPAQTAVPPAPRPGLTGQGAWVGMEFGQLAAATLAALTSLGPLRVTPWRMLLIEGATAMPEIPGLIIDAGDPMLRVTACTGAPGCLQAQLPTRALARRLAPLLTVPLHVSGCAKGCAHPRPAALTLTATPAGFAVIRNATAAGMGPIVAASDLPTFLTKTP
jgi:precorrin-3B synthase